MSKNILVVGDSYAAFSDEGTWPYYLGQYSNSVITCSGQCGGSNYVTLTNFRKNFYQSFDFVIVVLTSHVRVPIVNGFPRLCSSLDGNGDGAPSDFKSAMLDYVKYFYDDDMQYWITERVVRDIESACWNKKIIWLDALLYDEAKKTYNNIRHGIKIKGQLTEYSIQKELEEPFNISWQDYMDIVQVDWRKNHFSTVNQERIGKFLANIINKDGLNLTDKETDLSSIEWVTDPKLIFPDLFPSCHKETVKQIEKFERKFKKKYV